MWFFSLAEEFVPPLLAIAAVLIVGLVPAKVALAGFSSPIMAMLVGVYVLAIAISNSRLNYRFSLWLLIRLPDTPFFHQAALLHSGFALSPFMPPQNARLLLTLPFNKDIVDGLNLLKKSVAATALMALTFPGAMLFSAMLPTSKSANLTALAMLPAQLQAQFSRTPTGMSRSHQIELFNWAPHKIAAIHAL